MTAPKITIPANRIMKAEALYIHIPFCQNICHYCDFPKMYYYDEIVTKYLTILAKELELIPDSRFHTIYIGGGTPSSLSSLQLDNLLSYTNRFKENIAEFTIEVNPENMNEEKMQILCRHGVNRLSIGVQTFNESQLKGLGRKHCNADIIRLIDLAHKYHLDNISLDLIYGLPKQTIRQFRDDIKMALSLGIKHLSLYALNIEENTVFKINKVKSASEDRLGQMYQEAIKILKEHHFIHYEVSNFAVNENFISKHNMVYWRAEHYYGVGCGASGYLDNIRYQNTKSITKYNENNHSRSETTLTAYDREYEYIMLNLRTVYGINFNDYQRQFQDDFWHFYGDIVVALEAQKLILLKEESFAILDEYFLVINSIILRFINRLEEKKGGNTANEKSRV